MYYRSKADMELILQGFFPFLYLSLRFDITNCCYYFHRIRRFLRLTPQTLFWTFALVSNLSTFNFLFILQIDSHPENKHQTFQISVGEWGEKLFKRNFSLFIFIQIWIICCNPSNSRKSSLCVCVRVLKEYQSHWAKGNSDVAWIPGHRIWCCGCNIQIHVDYRNPVEEKGRHGHSLKRECPHPCLDRLLLFF